MAYVVFAAVAPLVVLAWGGRLVAASSEQARRKLRDAGVVPATRPPSFAGILMSGLVLLGVLGAVALLTL